ncbi:MAG: DUF3134 family protein [Hormoscilla sp. GM7CHS1pb]|nr:DUF3134 family protein [Hormoscilla sp. GM7CHS1pb]
MNNPSLREVPRWKPAEVIAVNRDSSLIHWLEATGRMSAPERNDDTEFIPEDEVGEMMDSNFDRYEESEETGDED